MAEAVAQGSLVLTLDAQQLNKGLSKAAKDVKAKSSEMGKTFKDSGREKIGEVFGGGSIAGMGAKAGAIGAGIAAAAFVGKELYEELIVKSKEYGRELEENERAVGKWADSVRDKYDAIAESLTEFSSVAGTSAGIKANEQALAKMRAELDGVTESKKRQEDAEKSYDSKWSSGKNFELWMSSKLEDTQKSEANKKKELIGLEDELRKKYEAQARALAKLKNPLTNPEAKAALKDFIMSQEDALAAIEGRTGDEQSLENMKRKFGWADAQLGAARAAIKAKELGQASKDADDLIKTLVEDVGELNGIAKKTAEETKLDDLIKIGADEQKIDTIRKLIEMKKRERQEYSPLQGLERGTAAEITFQNKSKFDEQKKADMAKELELLKQIATGINKAVDGIKKLDKDAPEF